MKNNFNLKNEELKLVQLRKIATKVNENNSDNEGDYNQEAITFICHVRPFLIFLIIFLCIFLKSRNTSLSPSFYSNVDGGQWHLSL